MKPNRDQVVAELKRELGMRKELFPSWVRMAKINQKTADLRMACIEEAIRIIESTNGTQTNLFG